MNKSDTGSLKFFLRYGLWTELAALLRMVNDLLVMSMWFITLAEFRIKWLEGFWVLALIYLGSYLFARLMQGLRWKIAIERGLFAGWILLLAFISYRILLMSHISMTSAQFLGQIFSQELSPDTIFGFWVLLFSMIAVLRGVMFARAPAGSYEMKNSLRWGLILFAAYALVFRHFHFDVFLPSFFVFLLSCLAGMSLARVGDLSEHYGGRLPGFTTQWAAGIAGATAGVILIGLLASLILNLSVAELIGKAVVIVLQFVMGAVVVISSPIIVAVIAVVKFLLKLISPNLEDVLQENELQLGENMLDDLQETAAKKLPVDPALFLMIAAVLAVVVIAIIQIRRRSTARRLLAEDDLADLEAPKKKTAPLLDLLPSFRKKRRATAKNLLAAARIRFVYSQLMDLCDRLGKPRPRAITPLEFLPRMDALFPLNHNELQIITNAYIKIRYGELPETDRDVDEVLEAWKTVNDLGKQMLDEQNAGKRRGIFKE